VPLADLQQANCIPDPNTIYVGQVILVPPGRVIGSPTRISPVAINCDNPAARITSPRPDAIVRGVLLVQGTATLPNFGFYKLEIRPDNDPVWRNINLIRTQVTTNGQLGLINSAVFPNGVYWIQLTVVDNTGNTPVLPCAVRVRFAN
jgi:hypothetical protein